MAEIIKYSYGIALCRRTKNRPLSILMIQKRCTYAYTQFVKDKYGKHDDETILHLLNKMTIAEKRILFTLDFRRIWGELNGIGTVEIFSLSSIYTRKADRFTENFIAVDGGRRLRGLIQQSKSYETVWDLPGGHKNAGETSIDAAIREVREETKIELDNYTLFYHVHPIIHELYDDGIKYVRTYFIADCGVGVPWDYQLRFHPLTTSIEIDTVRWMTTMTLQATSMNEMVIRDLSVLFKRIAARYKMARAKYRRLYPVAAPAPPKHTDKKAKDVTISGDQEYEPSVIHMIE